MWYSNYRSNQNITQYQTTQYLDIEGPLPLYIAHACQVEQTVYQYTQEPTTSHDY